jgi:SNF2 family DNA or RNA helicase
MIDNFENNSEFDILLISLKAGGVGLNLNSATNVVLFDRWWNPALENQAIQRAHRFGKKVPLNVYRFIISDTIEEKIENILKKKELLFDEMINDSTITEHNNLFTKEDLLLILQHE